MVLGLHVELLVDATVPLRVRSFMRVDVVAVEFDLTDVRGVVVGAFGSAGIYI